MSLRQRESELKLDILASLARSQKALAAMMETLADMSPRFSGEDRAAALKEIGAISSLQRALAEKILMVKLRPVRKGAPGPHWIAESCKIKAASRRS